MRFLLSALFVWTASAAASSPSEVKLKFYVSCEVNKTFDSITREEVVDVSRTHQVLNSKVNGQEVFVSIETIGLKNGLTLLRFTPMRWATEAVAVGNGQTDIELHSLKEFPKTSVSNFEVFGKTPSEGSCFFQVTVSPAI